MSPGRAVVAAGWLAIGFAMAQGQDAVVTVPDPLLVSGSNPTTPGGVAGQPSIAAGSPIGTHPMAPGDALPPAGIATLGQPATAMPGDVQIVRFSGPAGLQIEVLGPQAEIFASPVDDGLLTVAMRVGTGYRLRITNLPDRPGKELFPVVELLGHLHRPPGIDPLKYPVRIMFNPEDFDDVLDRGRLVTHIVYLEDPELAIPLRLPKQEIPVVTLNPAEDPLQVASALGRVVAVVRLGSRVPLTGEAASGEPLYDLGSAPCPFMGPSGGRCELPCGPVRGTPPPPGRPWMPRDEFLCDGGDRGNSASFGGAGGLRGIDPRDAVVRFRDNRQARVLPTNIVCVYAPRFAAVRLPMGPNEANVVTVLRGAEQVEQEAQSYARQGPVRMSQNQSPEANRGRSRPSGVISRVGSLNHFELRVLDGVDLVTHAAGHAQGVGPQIELLSRKANQMRLRAQPEGIQTGEGAVVTGIVEGAGQNVMAWKPQELAGVEEPPNKPGLAVVKQVSAAEAEPGDTLTYTISYRNMGNVPVTSVSVIDSLLPRLEYVRGSALGPKGAVFTASENQAGSTELQWDIGTLPPGESGAVSFEAKVR